MVGTDGGRFTRRKTKLMDARKFHPNEHDYLNSVNGTQYVAALTEKGNVTLYRQFLQVKVPRTHNAI